MVRGIFKIPRNTFWNKTMFSMFYICITTFPFVMTFMYWFVLDGASSNDHGPFTNFLIFNANIVNSFIALIEIFILSSVRKQLVWYIHTGICLVRLTFSVARRTPCRRPQPSLHCILLLVLIWRVRHWQTHLQSVRSSTLGVETESPLHLCH